jgi:hypothetical protein
LSWRPCPRHRYQLGQVCDSLFNPVSTVQRASLRDSLKSSMKKRVSNIFGGVPPVPVTHLAKAEVHLTWRRFLEVACPEGYKLPPTIAETKRKAGALRGSVIQAACDVVFGPQDK